MENRIISVGQFAFTEGSGAVYRAPARPPKSRAEVSIVSGFRFPKFGPFSRQRTGKDLTAGLTTALVTIPDGLASAVLAGLNPVGAGGAVPVTASGVLTKLFASFDSSTAFALSTKMPI